MEEERYQETLSFHVVKGRYGRIIPEGRIEERDAEVHRKRNRECDLSPTIVTTFFF